MASRAGSRANRWEKGGKGGNGFAGSGRIRGNIAAKTASRKVKSGRKSPLRHATSVASEAASRSTSLGVSKATGTTALSFGRPTLRWTFSPASVGRKRHRSHVANARRPRLETSRPESARHRRPFGLADEFSTAHTSGPDPRTPGMSGLLIQECRDRNEPSDTKESDASNHPWVRMIVRAF